MQMNPILQRMQTPNLNQIRNMMNTVKNAGNPQAMLMNMAQNNPRIKQAMDVINQSGGDPQKAFYALAEQKGVNPEDILSQLR